MVRSLAGLPSPRRVRRLASGLGVLAATAVLGLSALDPGLRGTAGPTEAAGPAGEPLLPGPEIPEDPGHPELPPPEAEPASGSPLPASGSSLAFGMDAGSIDAQQAAGFDPDVATIWIGPWTLQHGWQQPDRLLAEMASEGITPAVHVYYWGDDISPTCLEDGCWSSLHDVRKDPEGWQRLVEETVEHLDDTLNGSKAMIILESEFNKASVARYEPLDAQLQDKVAFIQEAYPAAEVALAFGNWNHRAWSTWDRAADQADAVGVQAMRASTQNTLSGHLGLFNATLEGVQWLDRLFGKPIVLQDISVSSYPEPAFLTVQADALARLFDGLDELEKYGVTTVLYRAWFDNPDMDPDNHFGIAERFWGLVSYPNPEPKPALEVWLDGVEQARSGSDANASRPSIATASSS